MRLATSLSFMLVLSVPALSQEPGTAEAALTPLVPRGKVVRLRADQARVTGRLIAAEQGVATLDTEQGTRTIALRGIDTVWVRNRAWKTGAIVGGGIGMVALGVFTGLVVHATCETSDCGTAAAALAGGGIGLASGALLGAAIGAAFPRWNRRFP
jgi:hypothetical protein